jgi:signal transduction histidine kinase
VFDRFHRGVDQPGGTGLGLAIADSVVRASNGTWHIGRAPLGGTRMEVSWRRIGTRRSDETGRQTERTTGVGRTPALPTFLR